MLRRSLSEPYNIVLAKHGDRTIDPPNIDDQSYGDHDKAPKSCNNFAGTVHTCSHKDDFWRHQISTARVGCKPPILSSVSTGGRTASTTHFKTHRRVYIPNTSTTGDNTFKGQQHHDITNSIYDRRLYILEPLRRNRNNFSGRKVNNSPKNREPVTKTMDDSDKFYFGLPNDLGSRPTKTTTATANRCCCARKIEGSKSHKALAPQVPPPSKRKPENSWLTELLNRNRIGKCRFFFDRADDRTARCRPGQRCGSRCCTCCLPAKNLDPEDFGGQVRRQSQSQAPEALHSTYSTVRHDGPYVVGDRGYACKLKRYQRPAVCSEMAPKEDYHRELTTFNTTSRNQPPFSRNRSSMVPYGSPEDVGRTRRHPLIKSFERSLNFRNSINNNNIDDGNTNMGPNSSPAISYRYDEGIHNGCDSDSVPKSPSTSGSNGDNSICHMDGKLTFGIHRLVVEHPYNKSSYVSTSKSGELCSRLNSLASRIFHKPKNLNSPNTLLDGISTELQEGEMLILLGNKGSGKSLLLDTLMNVPRVRKLQIFGKFHINGKLLERNLIGQICAYVNKNEILLPFLTVEEMLLYFTSTQPIPISTAGSLNSCQNIKKVMKDLKIGNLRNTYIQNLSSGDKLLIKIACQVLLNKDMLLFDEPDEGIEPLRQNFIIDYLRDLSSTYGKIVICSLDNPSFGDYLAFNKAAILSNGCLVYYGLSKDIVTYFESIGFRSPYYTNPCDFYVDLSTVDRYSTKSFQKSLKRVKMLQEMCASKCLLNIPSTALDELDGAYLYGRSGPAIQQNPSKVSWWTRTLNMICLVHSPTRRMSRLKVYIRDVFLMIMLSVLIGGIFYDIKFTQLSIYDRIGILFTMVILVPLMLVFEILRQNNYEMEYYAVALEENYFGRFSFILMRFMSDLLPNILTYTMLVSPAYWISGLRTTSPTFAAYTLHTVLGVLSFKVLAITVSTVLSPGPKPTQIGLTHRPFSPTNVSYVMLGVVTLVGATTGYVVNFCQLVRGHMGWFVSYPILTPLAGLIFRTLVANELDSGNVALYDALYTSTNGSRAECSDRWRVAEYPVKVNGIVIIKNMTVQRFRECRYPDIVSHLFGTGGRANGTSKDHLGPWYKSMFDFDFGVKKMALATTSSTTNRSQVEGSVGSEQYFYIIFYVTVYVMVCFVVLFVRLKCLPKR